MALDEFGNEIIIQTSESEQRIKQLSGLAKSIAEERDTEKKAREDAEGKVTQANLERDFYQGFSDVLGKHPQANEHKEDIKAKVMTGMSVQDATYAVLGGANKLGQPAIESHPIAGGSASNSLPQSGTTKTVAEMSREEKRATILDLEKQGIIGLN